MTEATGLHVLGLAAKNYMGLKCLELRIGPEGVMFSGPNGSCKSSSISILTACIGGAKAEPQVPIRTGSFSAEIKTILGRDGVTKYVVTKTWEPNSKGVVEAKLVVTADVNTVTSPQKLLDGFLSALAFDVGEFIHPPGAKTVEATAKAQTEILLQACPLDVNLIELATKRLRAFNDRRDVKRDADKLAAELRTVEPGEAPPEVDLTALTAQLQELRSKRAASAAAEQRVETLKDRAARLDARIKDLSRQLGEAQQEALDVEKMREEALAVPVVQDRDLAALEETVAKGREQNSTRAEIRGRTVLFQRRMGELADTRKKADELTATIERCDEERDAALARAAFPYPGLGLEEGVGVVLQDADTGNKLPFGQLNTALQVQIAFRVLAKLSPGLRVAIVREGNALDHASLAALAREARVSGFQLFVERIVGDDALPSVVFEDGAVQP